MSLRWRIALAMAAISVVATAAIGYVSYDQTRDRLLAEVDASLVALDRFVSNRRIDADALPDRGPLSGLYVQVVDRGVVRLSTFPEPVPVSDAVGAGGGPRGVSFETVTVDGERYRIRTLQKRRATG